MVFQYKAWLHENEYFSFIFFFIINDFFCEFIDNLYIKAQNKFQFYNAYQLFD